MDDTGAIASLDRFLENQPPARLRDSLPETEITLLEVLEKLNAEVYPPAPNCDAFRRRCAAPERSLARCRRGSAHRFLDLAYPADYLLAESWERLRRAFYFLDNLNAGAATVTDFRCRRHERCAHAKTLKELLRSKFGAETWLTLSAEIQDVFGNASGTPSPLICSPSHSPPMLPAANGKTQTTCTPTTCSMWKCPPAN